MTPLQRAQALKPELRPRLLRWFDRARRDLPWRRTSDPYGVWVSEVMLQQTQVDRVVQYWTAFIQKFPNVRALAQAPLQDVLSLWAGLGYYSRARNLHRAAQEVALQYQGELPDSVEALLNLPGFGKYTAGAVASIAFGLEAPLVDGNVARVLSRILEVEGSPGDKDRERTLWACAEVLVQGSRPGDWNQSLMELGATVCAPKKPECGACPVKGTCGALAHHRVDELPPPKKAAKRKRLELAVAVASRQNSLLLGRRKEEGLFGGLWELPSNELASGQQGARSLQHLLGPKAAVGPELAVIERTLTHRDLVLRLHRVSVPATLTGSPSQYVEWQWVNSEDIASLGMSSAMRQAIVAAKNALRGEK